MPTPRLLVATRNPGKAREFQDLIGNIFEVISLLDLPPMPDVDETGETFEANARLKALALTSKLEDWVLADDSGLEVDALGGAPGVKSARYGGEMKCEVRNREMLLKALTGIPLERRHARFRCVLVLARKGEVIAVCEGTCPGRILESAEGVEGFGYDSLFVPEGASLGFGQMTLEEKHHYSHRARAMKALKAHLDRIIAASI